MGYIEKMKCMVMTRHYMVFIRRNCTLVETIPLIVEHMTVCRSLLLIWPAFICNLKVGAQ